MADPARVARLGMLGFTEEEITRRTRKPRRKTSASGVPLEHVEMQEFRKAVDGAWGRALGIAGEVVCIPNSAPRGEAAAAYFRSEGLRNGYPDLLLDVAAGPYHGLRLEMKRIKGGRIEDDEQKWHERLRSRGFAVVVPRGHQEAKAYVERYLRGEIVP